MRLRKLWDWPRLNCVTFRKLGGVGRLGNQLFQIATTIGYAQLHSLRYLFCPWSSAEHFPLEGCFTKRLHTYREFRHMPCVYRPIPKYRSVNLHGYFQSEKYFAHCKDLIRKLLTPRNTQPTFQGVASIHVRRGDYVKYSGHYEVLDMNYFEKAMERVGVDRFLIFSTDQEWCKEHFVGNQFDFSEGRSAEEDLALMTSCQDYIIANSSFSWWAAWLNPSPTKRVITPTTWFGPKQRHLHDLNSMLPPEWIRVDSNPSHYTIGA